MKEGRSGLATKIALALFLLAFIPLLPPDLIDMVPAASQASQMSEPTQVAEQQQQSDLDNGGNDVNEVLNEETGVIFIYPDIPHVNLTPIKINRTRYTPILDQPTRCELHPNWPNSIMQYCGWITLYSEMHGIDPNVTAAIMMQESGGDPTSLSYACAVGLMQVMPNDGPLIKTSAYPFIACDPVSGSVSTYRAYYHNMFDDRPSTAELWPEDFNIFSGTYILSQVSGDYNYKVRAYYGITDGGGDEYYLSKVLGHYKRITGQNAFPSFNG